MIIAVTANGTDLDSLTDERLDQCSQVIFYDTQNGVMDVADNPASETAEDAATLAAKMIVDHGAQVLLTGKVGRDAGQILAAAGVDVYINTSGSVKEALSRFVSGELTLREGPATGMYPGLGSPATAAPPRPEPGKGAGVGQARGVGTSPLEECVCPFCGETAPSKGKSCRDLLCAKCNVPLVKDFSKIR
jgi:predicted Fe-Mo cluster-binding NifX family protein